MLRTIVEVLRRFADEAEDVFWVMDARQERMVYVSRAFRDLWGREPGDLCEGRLRWLDTVHAEDRARVEREVLPRLRAGQPSRARYRIVRPDGGIRWVLDRAFPLHDDAGGLLGYTGIVRDETRPPLRHEALERAERLAALGTLVAGVAHEINNPLSFVRGNLELTLMRLDDQLARPEPDPELREALLDIRREQEVALRGIDTIAGITRNLRHVARPASGPRAPLDPNQVARDIVQLASATTRPGVQVAADLRARQPVVSTYGELSQVLLNLVLNANDALANGGGRLVVRSRDEDGHVLLEVEDDGAGIPAETAARLFSPFFTTKPQGTGLGLSISRAIAQDNGGSLDFRTEPGAGTTFTLRLPAAAAPDAVTSAER